MWSGGQVLEGIIKSGALLPVLDFKESFQGSHYSALHFIRLQTNFLLQVALAEKGDGESSIHEAATKEDDRLE